MRYGHESRQRRHHPEGPGHEFGPGHETHEGHDHDHGHGPQRGGQEGRGRPGRGGFERLGGFQGRGGFEGRGGFDGRRGGRGRAQRGDVRAATLLLLQEQPMHGYQLMQAMAERTNGVWRPSPGAIYPTIAQLEDEGLVTTLAEGGRKLVTLTDAGRAYLADNAQTLVDPFADMLRTPGQGFDLRSGLEEIAIASKLISRSGDEQQLAAAAAVLAEAKRALYLILADGAAPKAEVPVTTESTPTEAG